jgi:hypothetical protein
LRQTSECFKKQGKCNEVVADAEAQLTAAKNGAQITPKNLIEKVEAESISVNTM